MRPKKIREIVKKTANDLDLPESTIDTITSFYWLQVRNTINEVDTHSLSINGLGTFYIKPWVLNKLISKNEIFIKNFTNSNIKKMTFQKYAILDQAQSRLKILKEIKEDILLEKERKKEITKKRKKHVSDKNLEREK